MKRKKYIEQFTCGELINELFCVKAARTGTTKAGKPYLILTLMDKSGELSVPVWENAEHTQSLSKVGEIIRCRGKVDFYEGQKQIKDAVIDRVTEDEIDISDYRISTRTNRVNMADEFRTILKCVEPPLQKILLFFFGEETECWRTFQDAAAAKNVHHAYVGGLLEHSLSVAKICLFLAEHYPGIDKSLLITGALLHDIGKLKEMEFRGAAIEYTTAGQLKGHLIIGCEMIREAADTIPNIPSETLEQLEHLILSHHGRREFGSPILPMTPEAFLLSMVDDMDAKMNFIENLRYQLESEQFSFSEYQRLLERSFYLRGYDKNERAEIESGSSQKKRIVRKTEMTEIVESTATMHKKKEKHTEESSPFNQLNLFGSN